MRPTSEAELCEAIRDAGGPLRVRGGGTRDIGLPVAGEVLETGGLSGIVDYEPGALTLVVRAGTPMAEIEPVLAAEGQALSFEPMDHRALLGTDGAPTIGGVVAGNVSGPRRVSHAGACRDSLLGVRFVDGRGRVIRNGGRVMKNVTGYDLTKLMAGARGSLGVLTEVSLKVLPRPEAAATVVLSGLDDARAVAAMSAALGSPFEVSGAAHDAEARLTRLRVEGLAGSVAYRARRLAELLSPFGQAELIEEAATVAGTWTAIRDVTDFAGRDGDVWRLALRPSRAAALAARAEPRAARYDWGGGLVWLLMDPGTDLRARTGSFDGHATLVRASQATRAALAVFPPQPASVAALTAGLKATFDPRGILNPGEMI